MSSGFATDADWGASGQDGAFYNQFMDVLGDVAETGTPSTGHVGPSDDDMSFFTAEFASHPSIPVKPDPMSNYQIDGMYGTSRVRNGTGGAVARPMPAGFSDAVAASLQQFSAQMQVLQRPFQVQGPITPPSYGLSQNDASAALPTPSFLPPYPNMIPPHHHHQMYGTSMSTPTSTSASSSGAASPVMPTVYSPTNQPPYSRAGSSEMTMGPHPHSPTTDSTSTSGDEDMANAVDVILGNLPPPPSKRSKRGSAPSAAAATTAKLFGNGRKTGGVIGGDYNDADGGDQVLSYDNGPVVGTTDDMGAITATAAQLRNGRTVDQLLERMHARDAAAAAAAASNNNDVDDDDEGDASGSHLGSAAHGGGGGGAGRRPHKRKRGELQKAKHNVAEKKRRSEMNDAIDRIKVLLPQREENGVKATKVSVLLETADYIEKVQALCCRLAEENQALMEDNARVRAQLSAMRVADQWDDADTSSSSSSSSFSLDAQHAVGSSSSGSSLGQSIATTALLTVLFFTFWGSFLNVFELSDSEYGITRVLLSIPSQPAFSIHVINVLSEICRNLWNLFCWFRFVFVVYLLSAWRIKFPSEAEDGSEALELERAGKALQELQGLRVSSGGATRCVKAARRVAKLLHRPIPKPGVSLYVGLTVQFLRFICLQLWFGYWLERLVMRMRGVTTAAAKSFAIESHALHLLVDLSPRTDATFWYVTLCLYNDATVFPGDSPSEQLLVAKCFKGMSIRLRHQFQLVCRLFANHCDKKGSTILSNVMLKLGPVKPATTSAVPPPSASVGPLPVPVPVPVPAASPANAALLSPSLSTTPSSSPSSISPAPVARDGNDDDDDADEEEGDDDYEYDSSDDEDDGEEYNIGGDREQTTATVAQVQETPAPPVSIPTPTPAQPTPQVASPERNQPKCATGTGCGSSANPLAALPEASVMGAITSTVSAIMAALDAGELNRVESLGQSIIESINESSLPTPMGAAAAADGSQIFKRAAFGRAQFNHIVAFAQYCQGRYTAAYQSTLRMLADCAVGSEQRVAGLVTMALVLVDLKKLDLARKIIDYLKLNHGDLANYPAERQRLMLLLARYHALREEYSLAGAALDTLMRLSQQRDLRFTELVMMQHAAEVSLDVWARLKYKADDASVKSALARYQHFAAIAAKASCTSNFFKPGAFRLAARFAALNGDLPRASQLFGKAVQSARDMNWEHAAQLALATSNSLGVQLSAAEVSLAI